MGYNVKRHGDKVVTAMQHKEANLEPILPSQPSKGTSPADTLMSNFQSSKLRQHISVV
jgi:hypothetical protein